MSNAFFSTLEAVATLLVIGVLGFWLVARRVVARDALGTLYPLALNVAMPALVFANIVRNFDPGTKVFLYKHQAFVQLLVKGHVVHASGQNRCDPDRFGLRRRWFRRSSLRAPGQYGDHQE